MTDVKAIAKIIAKHERVAWHDTATRAALLPWLRWHNGSDVGSTPGFRHGGKVKGEPRG